jgi:diguanylate cyclase (GGDEF)-like protein
MIPQGIFDVHFETASAIFLAASILITILAFAAWSRRSLPANTPFAFLMIAVAIWLFGRSFEGAVMEQSAKIFWAKIEYLGIPWVGVLWLGLALSYAQKVKWLNRRNILLLSIIPILTTLITFTNELHSLTWTQIAPSPGSNGKVLVYSHGIWFWVYTIYSYVAILLGTIQMLQTAILSRRIYKYQATSMLIGALLPILSNLLYLAGQSPIPGMDLTPFGFACSGVIFAWTIFRYQLFQHLPVAREMLIDNMEDGILVVNEENKILDTNQATRRLLNLPDQMLVGQFADEVLADYPLLLEALSGSRQNNLDLHLEGQTTALLDIRITPLVDQVALQRGSLIVIRDDTRHKLAQEKIQQQVQEEHTQVEQRDFLHTITAELTSEFDLTTLLEKIIDRAISLLEVSAGELALYDENKDDLEIVVSRGLDQDFTGDRMAIGEGIMGVVGSTRQPLSINNYGDWEGRSDRYSSLWDFATLGIPLLAGDELMGVITIGIDNNLRTFNNRDIDLLSMFASQAALAILNARLFKQMELLATTDPLTGLFNRRQFFLQAQTEFVRARRYNSKLTAIMIDIDHFKLINDQHGHLTGDRVLQNVARICQESLRVVDLIGRYGGEEFIILLPETGIETAYEVADRLRENIADLHIENKTGLINLTISLGVASPAEEGGNLEALLDKADTALYAAKQAGRNCVKIYGQQSQ